jgi:hypothetical protein
MAVSEAKKQANKKWTDENYERITVKLRKEVKDLLKQYVESKGETMNGLINTLIDQSMGNETPQSKNDTRKPRIKPNIQLPMSKGNLRT